jgi:hypothetical protein
MKYGKYWFHLQKQIIAYFHVLGLFIPKKFPSVTRRCWPVVGRNLYRRYLSRLKSYRIEISTTLRQLGWIDAPPTQNFEILKSLEQTQESKKKIKITFEIFVKMLDGLNFGKRCLLRCSIWNFFRIGKF